MELSQADQDKLLNFVGYGSLDAPFWFIGMEEAGPAHPDLLEANLRARLRFADAIMDLHQAHDENHLRFPYWDAGFHERLPSVWVYAARFVRALRGAADWWDLEPARAYVRDRLGRAGYAGETFLTDLLPLPRKRMGDWPPVYRDGLGFSDLAAYEQAVLPRRKQLLKPLISEQRPRFLLCYGRSYYAHYRELVDVQPDRWRTLPQTRIEIGMASGTTVILTPFMGSGRLGQSQFEILIEYLPRMNL